MARHRGHALFAAAWFYTGALFVSINAAIASAVLNTIAYYLHERLWNRSAWGRE